MEMPKPTDAHRKLAILLGQWTAQEQMFPSPCDPNGGTATGHAENRWAVDGFVMTHDYVQERDGVPTFHGLGVFSYDGAENVYVLHWWDSMGMAPNVFKGPWVGDALSLVCPMQDGQGQCRIVWEFKSEGHYNFKMELTGEKGEWVTSMVGDYVRES